MSYFSYISFPRLANKSCLRYVEVVPAHLREEKYRCELEAIRRGEADTSPKGIFIRPIRWGETFQLCFSNDFIYEFSGYIAPPDFKWNLEGDVNEILTEAEKQSEKMSPPYRENYIQSTREMINNDEEMAKWREIQKRRYDEAMLCKEQLCQLAELNLYPGETIEIYSEWGNHIDFNFGPPAQIVVVDSREIMTSYHLGESESDMINDKKKIEIRCMQ